MKTRQLRILTLITLALLAITLIWIFYHLYAYTAMKSDSSLIGSLDNGIGAGFIVRILLYISFALMLFRAFSAGLKPGVLLVISIISGIFSALSVVMDWAALVDIYHDYPNGYECRLEWTWLFGSLAGQLIFCITGLILAARIIKGKAL